VLKQLGSGSIAAGVYATVKDASSQVNVARILSVEQRLLADELARLPRSKPGTADVDLAKMYDRLKAVPMRRSSLPVSPEFDQHRDVFMWCVILLPCPCVPIVLQCMLECSLVCVPSPLAAVGTTSCLPLKIMW
jgi:hypothetical protein